MSNLVSKIDNLLNWEDFEDNNNHINSTFAEKIPEMSKQDKTICNSSFAKNVQELKELSEQIANFSLEHLPKESEVYLKCVNLRDRMCECDTKIQTSLKEANNLLKPDNTDAKTANTTYGEITKSASHLFSLDRHVKATKLQAMWRGQKFRILFVRSRLASRSLQAWWQRIKFRILFGRHLKFKRRISSRFASLVKHLKVKRDSRFASLVKHLKAKKAAADDDAKHKQLIDNLTNAGTIFPADSMIVEKRMLAVPQSEKVPNLPSSYGFFVLFPTKMIVDDSIFEIAKPPANIRFYIPLEEMLGEEIPSDYTTLKKLMSSTKPFRGEKLPGSWKVLGYSKQTSFRHNGGIDYLRVASADPTVTQGLTKVDPPEFPLTGDVEEIDDPDGFASEVHENSTPLILEQNCAELQQGAYSKPMMVKKVPKLMLWQKKKLFDVNHPAKVHSAEYILTEGAPPRHYLVHLYLTRNGNQCQNLFMDWADDKDLRFKKFIDELADGDGMLHGPYSHKELLNFFKSHVIAASKQNMNCLLNLNMCIFTHVSYKYTRYDDQVQSKPALCGKGSVFLRRKSAKDDNCFVRQEKVKFENITISKQFLINATTASKGWLDDFDNKVPALVNNLWDLLNGRNKMEWIDLFRDLSLINNKLLKDISDMERAMIKLKSNMNVAELIPSKFQLWIPLRPGSGEVNSVDENRSKTLHIKQENQLKFQQNGADTCVACAAGNVILAYGLSEEWAQAVFSELVMAQNTINDDKDILASAIQKHCPGYELKSTSAPPFRPTGPPRILFYEDRAGAKDHAFSVFSDKLYDGRFKHPLKASKESLSVICPNGVKKKGPCHHYSITKKKKTSMKSKKHSKKRKAGQYSCQQTKNSKRSRNAE
jgi:hypothetical protein